MSSAGGSQHRAVTELLECDPGHYSRVCACLDDITTVLLYDNDTDKCAVMEQLLCPGLPYLPVISKLLDILCATALQLHNSSTPCERDSMECGRLASGVLDVVTERAAARVVTLDEWSFIVPRLCEALGQTLIGMEHVEPAEDIARNVCSSILHVLDCPGMEEHLRNGLRTFICVNIDPGAIYKYLESGTKLAQIDDDSKCVSVSMARLLLILADSPSGASCWVIAPGDTTYLRDFQATHDLLDVLLQYVTRVFDTDSKERGVFMRLLGKLAAAVSDFDERLEQYGLDRTQIPSG